MMLPLWSAATSRSEVLPARLFILIGIKSGVRPHGSRLILRDWGHRLPSMVDESKNLAVIAKSVQVARISCDLNYGPRHAISLWAK
jgi:hypothetical protein